ncbi:MAG: urea ABC transporter permease subunit UrtB [Candidatus Rokubacteria bacterium]|nr:urea ABC transporter permease subunit UrtB [Candidatus Rokubacteria bacterium]
MAIREVVVLAAAFALLAFAVAAAPGVALAAPGVGSGDLDALAARLADPKIQAATLESLVERADPAVEPLVRALKDGALYRLKTGRFVMLGDDASVKWLTGEPAVDPAGQPVVLESGQEGVAVEEANFGIVNRLLERFDVFNPKRSVREAAAVKLGNSRDPGMLALLAAAAEREKDPAVRRLIDESWAKLELLSSDPAVRIHAVRYLAALKTEVALAQFRALVAQEQDPAVKAATTEAVRDLESYVARRNIVGYVFNGISLGAVLLIMSLGLAVTFGLMGIINMAHGEMLMIGSYTAFVIQELFTRHLAVHQDYYFFVALPLSFLVAGLVGLLLEASVIRFLYGRPLETLIVTWGIGMIFQQAARLWFGDQTSVNPPTWFRGGVEAMPGLILPWSRIFIVGLALVVLGVLYWLLQGSYAGLRVRAVMQNRPMASCLGVSTRRIDAMTFALGTGLAGVAGCALALIGTVDPEVGKTYIVDSFMVVVLGGVGKLMGTVVASAGIGISNKLLEPSIGGTAAAVYAKVAILVIVILFLQWRPTGLFRQRGRVATESAA